jgi:hypothetical protein
VINRRLREGGREYLNKQTAEERKRLVEERRLVPGMAVTFNPESKGHGVFYEGVFHIKSITSNHYVRLEEMPGGGFNPVGILPARKD